MAIYGLIADIHGNMDNLSKAITILEGKKADKILHLGDVIGGFNFPNQVIELLCGKGIEGISGQHDLTELKYPSIPLSPASNNYLNKLPLKIFIEKDIILAHDNPLQTTFGKGYWYHGSYIRNSEDAKRVFEGCSYRLIMVGHTHQAKVLVDNGEDILFENGGILKLDDSRRYILNPGSVGFPKDDPDSASCALYDTIKKFFEVIRFS